MSIASRKIDTLRLLELLDLVLEAHGYISDPECRRVRCECSTCEEAWEFMDDARERGVILASR